MMSDEEKVCPFCRNPQHPRKTRENKAFSEVLEGIHLLCRNEWCRIPVLYINFKAHLKMCSLQDSISIFKPKGNGNGLKFDDERASRTIFYLEKCLRNYLEVMEDLKEDLKGSFSLIEVF